VTTSTAAISDSVSDNDRRQWTVRLVFAGTPAAAVPSLQRLHGLGFEIVAVITRPDAPLGRRRILTPSPVAQMAEKLGLRVIRAARLDAETTTLIATHRPDLGVIVAYGGLVGDPLLRVPTHGWINLHFSLLPAWRGAAPVQHSLIAGGCGVGTSVFRLVSQLDAGDLYASQPHALAGHETAGDVVDALARSGASLLADVVTSIRAGTAHTTVQVGEPTFAPKLTLDDARLDWTHPAPTVLARFRGVTPEPGAWTTVDGVRLKIRALALDTADATALPAAPGSLTVPPPVVPGICATAPSTPLAPGEFALRNRRLVIGTATVPLVLLRVQPEGRVEMDASAWWRGFSAPTRRIVARSETVRDC